MAMVRTSFDHGTHVNSLLRFPHPCFGLPLAEASRWLLQTNSAQP